MPSFIPNVGKLAPYSVLWEALDLSPYLLDFAMTIAHDGIRRRELEIEFELSGFKTRFQADLYLLFNESISKRKPFFVKGQGYLIEPSAYTRGTPFLLGGDSHFRFSAIISGLLYPPTMPQHRRGGFFPLPERRLIP